MRKILVLFSALFILLSSFIGAETIYAGGDAYTSEDWDYFVIEKVWDDNDDEKQYRPDSITVNIKTASGKPVGDGQYTISKSDNWRLKLSFPHSSEDYFVTEEPVEGYLGKPVF